MNLKREARVFASCWPNGDESQNAANGDENTKYSIQNA